jgi:type IV secretion system protein VirD4
VTFSDRLRTVAGASAASLALITAQVATQQTAANLGHQPALGAPLTMLFGRPVYGPWSFFLWEYRFRSQALRAFAPVEDATQVGWGLVGLGAVIALLKRKKPATTYGSARWGTVADLEKARLLGPEKGMVLAQTHDAVLVERKGVEGQFDIPREGQVLRHDGPDHVMMFAPPRSGKGVGPFLANLYEAPRGPDDVVNSAVVFDMTGENYAKSAGHRARFSRCIKLAPNSRETHRYNPLLDIRPGDHEIGGAQKLARYCVESSGQKEEGNRHFEDTASELIAGAVIHVLYVAGPKNLPAVEDLFSDHTRSPKELMEMMLDTKHLGDRVHPFVAKCANDQLRREEREQGAVLSTVRRHLSVFRDPLAANAVSQSDFSLEDLRDGDRPYTVYLVTPKSDNRRLRPILRLFLNQLAAKYTEDRTKRFKRDLDLYLDEFTSLGALPAIAEGTAYFGGAGVRMFINIHDIDQLVSVYGPHNPFLTNCKVKITYTLPSFATASKVSDWIGSTTMERKDGQGKPVEYGRPLIYADELMKLPFDEALVFKTGMPPYRGKKLVTYSMNCYRGLDAIPPPDSPAAMAAQCPPPRPHAWSAMAALPATARPKPVVVKGGGEAQSVEGDQEAGQAGRAAATAGALDGRRIYEKLIGIAGKSGNDDEPGGKN